MAQVAESTKAKLWSLGLFVKEQCDLEACRKPILTPWSYVFRDRVYCSRECLAQDTGAAAPVLSPTRKVRTTGDVDVKALVTAVLQQPGRAVKAMDIAAMFPAIGRARVNAVLREAVGSGALIKEHRGSYRAASGSKTVATSERQWKGEAE